MLKIKEAKENDMNLVKELLNEAELPVDDIKLGKVLLFMFYQKNKFVGISGLEQYGSQGLLRSLVVKTSLRNKSFGRQIVDLTIERAQKLTIQRLYLLTTTASGFFKNLGFNQIAKSQAPMEVQGSAEFTILCPDDAVCMEKELV